MIDVRFLLPPSHKMFHDVIVYSRIEEITEVNQHAVFGLLHIIEFPLDNSSLLLLSKIREKRQTLSLTLVSYTKVNIFL